MKKQIAFVMPSLDAGGGEKSLVNLLNAIDYNTFDVDLILFHKRGLFLDLVPKGVRLIDLNQDYLVFSKSVPQSVTAFLTAGKFRNVFNRIVFAIKNSIHKNKAIAEQQSWNNISQSISALPKKYDVAIGFLEKSSIYFVVDKIVSKNKIGWIHTNYSNSGMHPNFDLPYFEKLNHIVAVSNECADNLQINFPSQTNKITTIHNIISPKLIWELANEPVENKSEKTILSVVTVGRLSHEKGIDLAIEACAIIKNAGIAISWSVIGDGHERNKLKSKIRECGLEENFYLLGLKKNPYPFVKHATIYVQPSRYEGKSIAVDEAKVLNKPIIVTDYETAADQISDMENGIISKMNPEALAENILKLFNDENLRNKFALNLSESAVSENLEITQFYNLCHE